MIFANPWALILLAVLPILGWKMWRPARPGSASILYSDIGLLSLPKRGRLRPWLAQKLPWLRLPALALLIVALARPQIPAGIREIGGAGVDIMLVLDISGSMQAEDFRPHNRFYVAKSVVGDFIERAGANRLGLVIFAGRAFTQCPLTTDHQIVKQLLQDVHLGMLEDGTAIGMAIATAAHRLQASSARSKVMILLTDGVNNRGEIDPPTAAEAAAALGIKIYTIGVGRPGGAPVPVPDPIWGRRYLVDPRTGQPVKTQLDEAVLKKIAQITGGQYFRATDADALRQIYAQIDKMEKSAFTAKRERRYQEAFGKYAAWGLALLAFQTILATTWLRKAP